MKENILIPKISENTIKFEVNSKIFPIETVQNTAYIFIDRVFVFLDGDPKYKVKIFLKGKEKMSARQLEAVAGEFNNELLNQILRLQIAKNNKKLQEYIVGQALFGASPEQISAEGHDNSDNELDKILERELKALEKEERNMKNKRDPMGVLIPWEKKNKKKCKK